MKKSITLGIVFSLLILITGNLAAQIQKSQTGSIPYKFMGAPQFGTDVPLYTDSTQNQRLAALSVAFNGWLYACYSLGDGGFTIVKSTDNGLTWDGWESVYWGAYGFTKLDIVVTGTTGTDLKVWVAYICYDLANTSDWYAGYQNTDGDLNALGYADLDIYTATTGFYDIAIASDYRSPGTYAVPYSLGILYSKYGSPTDSVIFCCSIDGGTTFGYRKPVATTGNFYGKVALSYGKSNSLVNGRYFAAWEEKVNQTGWDCNIYTSFTDPYINSDFVPQLCIDCLDGGISGYVSSPAISTQFGTVNNDAGGLTAVLLFDYDHNGLGTDYDVMGYYNKNTVATSNWNQFVIDNSSKNTVQPDVNFDPVYNNFLLTYFDDTFRKLPYFWETFNMTSPNSWNLVTPGYNDQANIVMPYPKVEINPALNQTAFVWIEELPGAGNGQAVFDAQYTINGAPVNGKPAAVELAGAYPDPCKLSTTIGFTLPQPEKVSIVLFDVYGNQVRDITDKTYGSGRTNETVDVSGLRAGVYYYSFKAGDFISSGKICVIR
jgi:hypothetical protein